MASAGSSTAATKSASKPSDLDMPESETRSSEWQATKRNFPNPGLTESQSSAITGIAKGNRPDPSTYLSSDYISQHRAQFDNGAVAFARDTSNVERFGQFGRDDGAFVLPRDVAEAMIKEANGNPRTLETLLGLEKGSLGNHPVLLEFDHVDNLRLPDGNEAGSNDFWRPGGLTYPGGVPEAIIDPVPADEVRAVKIW
ncbi:hypothetical protein AB3329_00115 [Streptococcus sp. H31]|uniref:hypothetical protein n=1 Tax=Streptococcus huangxiaojuni TaxID=3237239 RepID=UPI0034A3041D